MPIINVTLIEGRTPETKRALIKELTDAAERATGVPRAAVRVIIWEVPAAHFGVAGVSKAESP
ncbi:2-hydroxymuconate tautomerase [Zavarzinia sp.]|uniref:2-hydroxymuconate tautomerase n=1 Tax=Zavarzinia sp. TaxID=2027920 RepID=UPI003BB698EF|nr:2-hydroxymuconate tautomerase family protein [Zavarzinia sp.]